MLEQLVYLRRLCRGCSVLSVGRALASSWRYFRLEVTAERLEYLKIHA